MITHYGGIPKDLKDIRYVEKVNVIEDAATALMQNIKRKIGSFKRSFLCSGFMLTKNTTEKGGLLRLITKIWQRKLKYLFRGIDKSPWRRTNEKLS